MPNTQPSGAYNFYDWKTYDEKGGAQDLRNVYRNAGRFGNQLTDFSSPFYSSYANYLNKAIPGIGAGSFLSLLQAGGGNYGGSMAQAMALKSNADRQRRDSINTGLQGFAGQNLSMLPQLLGIQANTSGNIYQGDVQKQMNSDSQGGWLDFLGSIGGAIGGTALGGPLGGMIGGSLFGGGGNAMKPKPSAYGGY